jgi:glycosyltransferase involved in cell wall biosynthesis
MREKCSVNDAGEPGMPTSDYQEDKVSSTRVTVFYCGSKGGGIYDYTNLVRGSSWRGYSVYNHGAGTCVWHSPPSVIRSVIGGIILAAKLLACLLRKHSVIIVMVSPFNIVLPLVRVLSLFRGRLMYIAHNNLTFANTTSAVRNLFTVICEILGRLSADRLLFLSANVYNRSWIMWRKRGVVIGLGATRLNGPSSAMHEISDVLPHFLFIGRGLHYKGVDLIFEALPYINNKCVISICGKDVSRYATQDMPTGCVDLRVQDAWLSEEEMAARIATADCMLLPYRDVSQSGPLLLAIGHRKPVIVSNLAGFEEFLSHYAAHVVCEVEDPVSLAEAINKLAVSPSLLGELRDCAERDAVFFTWDRIRDRIEMAAGGK